MNKYVLFLRQVSVIIRDFLKVMMLSDKMSAAIVKNNSLIEYGVRRLLFKRVVMIPQTDSDELAVQLLHEVLQIVS